MTDTVVSSWQESVRSSFGKTIMGKAIWENPIETWLGENSQIGTCLFVHREKGLFLSVYVDDIKLAGKKQNINPMWKVLNKRSRFGRTNIFPWSCILGLHSTSMWSKPKILWTITEFESRISAVGLEKLPFPQNLRISSWSYDMRWTSSRLSISLDPSKKWNMLTNYWKFPNRSVQTFGYVYHDTKWPESWYEYGRSSRSSWAKSLRSSSSRTHHGKDNSRKFYQSTVGKKIPTWGLSICTQWERIILFCVCGWHHVS